MLMLYFENAYKALAENSDDTCGNIMRKINKKAGNFFLGSQVVRSKI